MGPEEGFNAQTEKFENLVQAGVIDPTKVVRSGRDRSHESGPFRTAARRVDRIAVADHGSGHHTDSGKEHGRRDAGHGRRNVLRKLGVMKQLRRPSKAMLAPLR